MDKKLILFRADDQALVRVEGDDRFASNLVSYIDAQFDLEMNWSGFDAVRAVWSSNTKTISMVLDSNGKCSVPAEVLRYPSRVLVNLVGSVSVGGVLEERLTTYPVVAFTVDKDVKLVGEETPYATPNQFEQYVGQVRDYWEQITDYRKDSEAWAVGKRNGDDVGSDDETYQNNSKYYADQASGSAQAAAADLAQLESEIDETVDDYLTAHPELTTTVMDNSLTTAKYKDSSVTTPKIADKAVTEAKLADAVAEKINGNTSDIAELTAGLGTLDSRVTNLATLEEGSTTGDAELIDTRVGADGTTYESAGAAVRGQVSDLKADIDDIREVVVGDNLYNYNNYVTGAIQSDGSVATNGVWGDQHCGDFFEIEGGETYYYAHFSGDVASTTRRNILFYDSAKQPITASYNSYTEYYSTISAPSNAKYCRISWYKTLLPVFSKVSTTTFIPYSETYVNKLLLDVDGEYKTADEVVDSLITKGTKQSKNLIDPSELVSGKFLSIDGSLSDLANYATTGFIPVTAGQKVTISPKLRSFMFFNAAKSPIGASYNNDDTGVPETFTATVDGYLRTSIYVADSSIAQVEYGDTATPYTPYFKYPTVENGIHLSDAMAQDVKEIVRGTNIEVIINGSNMTVQEPIGDKKLIRQYLVTGRSNKNFNFYKTFLDATFIKDCEDDITPQRLKYYDSSGSGLLWTVGANHGWMCYKTAKGSLAQADCGSIWSDGTRQYTLMVVDDSYAYFAFPCYKDGDDIHVVRVNPASNLSHVSGATHTSEVSISSGASGQFYPAINNRTIKIIANGEEIVGDASFTTDKLNVIEHYEIMDYVDMVNTMQANIGESLEDLKDSIDSILALDYNYEITSRTEVVYTTATAVTEVGMEECGFMQAAKVTPQNGTLYRYANGIKDGSLFASSSLHDMSGYNTDNYIYPSSLIDSNKPTNRAVDVCVSSGKIQYGFAIGFIPDMGYGADSYRKDLPVVWDMRSTGKLYPICLYRKALASGESVGVVGYRQYFTEQDITNKSVIEVGNKKYIFADAHSEFSSLIDTDSYGSDVKVIDSTDMDVQDFVGANGVAIHSGESYSALSAKIVD